MKTKSEVIKEIADDFQELPVKIVDQAIKEIFNFMGDNLVNKNNIEIRGFGTFTLREHAPRIAHNPRTKEKLMTETKYAIRFKPGKWLKDKVNDSKSHTQPVETKEDELALDLDEA